MSALWAKFQAWIASKGGWEHVLVALYTGFFIWFKASPAFQSLMTGLWAKTPSLLQTFLEALVQILAVYGVTTTTKVAVKAIRKKST